MAATKKITELGLTTTPASTDLVIVETSDGTKAITYENLTAPAIDDAVEQAESNLDPRNTYKKKYLGTSVTSAQKTAIQNGTFEGITIGSYWTINGVNWVVVDMDYWYNCGDTAFTKHHLIIMPETCLYTAQMNTTNTTEGGYVGSAMYTTNLADAKTAITSAFGDLVLTHREYLVNAVSNGKPSGGLWCDSTVELPSEVMIYGHSHFAPGCDGITIPTMYTINKTPLALFRLRPELITLRAYWWWLRDVVSSAFFARVDYHGATSSGNASTSHGVRPVFAIG